MLSGAHNQKGVLGEPPNLRPSKPAHLSWLARHQEKQTSACFCTTRLTGCGASTPSPARFPPPNGPLSRGRARGVPGRNLPVRAAPSAPPSAPPRPAAARSALPQLADRLPVAFRARVRMGADQPSGPVRGLAALRSSPGLGSWLRSTISNSSPDSGPGSRPAGQPSSPSAMLAASRGRDGRRTRRGRALGRARGWAAGSARRGRAESFFFPVR